ncbi:hypothetical protein LX32DRAFT_690056 [Colletotrichum zoysiae]|uniref:F-box domain-containing protein n=1 Tax=Colletotrichum zoysiae TaxID=1216348 RepID=A0AAD9HSI5_9PEZI|nr:hypothetical protein LX32DRAFT_690056 [Colletotrichum zoysiae]
MLQLLQRQEALRDAANRRNAGERRPAPSPLKLPGEIINNILSFELWQIEYIKNLRLTCRRFNEITSAFFIQHIRRHAEYLRVRMTPVSLARLQWISEHPILSTSVREVRLCLSYPRLEMARMPTAYVKAVSPILVNQVMHDEYTEHFEVDLVKTAGLKMKNVARHVEQKLLLKGTLHDFRASEVWPLLNQGLFPMEYPILQEAFALYGKLYDSYQQARLGFAGKIAEAMARLPRAAQLEITDESFEHPLAFEREKPALSYYNHGLPEDDEDLSMIGIYHRGEPINLGFSQLAGHVRITLKDIHRSVEWGLHSSDSRDCPVEVLFQLPALLAAKGIELTHVSINVSSPPKLPDAYPSFLIAYPSKGNLGGNSNCSNGDLNMRKFMSKLQHFEFEIKRLTHFGAGIFDILPYSEEESDSEYYVPPRKYSSSALEPIKRLLLQYMVSPALETITIGIKGISDFMVPAIDTQGLQLFRGGEITMPNFKWRGSLFLKVVASV